MKELLYWFSPHGLHIFSYTLHCVLGLKEKSVNLTDYLGRRFFFFSNSGMRKFPPISNSKYQIMAHRQCV